MGLNRAPHGHVPLRWAIAINARVSADATFPVLPRVRDCVRFGLLTAALSGLGNVDLHDVGACPADRTRSVLNPRFMTAAIATMSQIEGLPGRLSIVRSWRHASTALATQ